MVFRFKLGYLPWWQKINRWEIACIMELVHKGIMCYSRSVIMYLLPPVCQLIELVISVLQVSITGVYSFRNFSNSVMYVYGLIFPFPSQCKCISVIVPDGIQNHDHSPLLLAFTTLLFVSWYRSLANLLSHNELVYLQKFEQFPACWKIYSPSLKQTISLVHFSALLCQVGQKQLPFMGVQYFTSD